MLYVLGAFYLFFHRLRKNHQTASGTLAHSVDNVKETGRERKSYVIEKRRRKRLDLSGQAPELAAGS